MLNGPTGVRAWLWGVIATLGLGTLALPACSRPMLSTDRAQVESRPWSFALSFWDFGQVAHHLPQAQASSALPTSQNVVLAREAKQCRTAIFEAQQQPALPGAPGLENQRARVLARAKAEPVLFLETPRFVGEVSRGVQARRRALTDTEYPYDMVRTTLATFSDHPERLRELMLRDGYLYTEDPRAGNYLSTRLTLEKMFSVPSLTLLRGGQEHILKKDDRGLYVHASGPREGQRARLLLFDRIWETGKTPGPALHVDVRELAQREGFVAMQVVHLGERNIVAELKFGRRWVPALLDRDGTDLSINCLWVEPDEAGVVGRERDEAYRRALVLHSLRNAIATQVELGLPFDEPRTERGQQDGKLRAGFEQAYFRGKTSYKFNGDKYSVFDEEGQPMSPQVCIDFVTETLERASGMRFAPQGERPQKILGALNFDEILDGHRRQEMALRNYAKVNPHRLSILDYPQSRWVRYENVEEFFEFIEKNQDDMQPGDIIVIRGRAAWDRYKEVHTHTFFIYDSDPVTGVPTLLAGNSGKPRIVTWDTEMLRAPKRSIRHRMRPNMEWLYDHVVLRTPLRGERWAAPISLSD